MEYLRMWWVNGILKMWVKRTFPGKSIRSKLKNGSKLRQRFVYKEHTLHGVKNEHAQDGVSTSDGLKNAA